jgi:hypothetical protein
MAQSLQVADIDLVEIQEGGRVAGPCGTRLMGPDPYEGILFIAPVPHVRAQFKDALRQMALELESSLKHADFQNVSPEHLMRKCLAIFFAKRLPTRVSTYLKTSYRYS